MIRIKLNHITQLDPQNVKNNIFYKNRAPNDQDINDNNTYD